MTTQQAGGVLTRKPFNDPTSDALSRLTDSVALLHRLAQLPALPSRGWCAKAASALAGAFDNATCAVAMTRFNNSAVATGVECVGVAGAEKRGRPTAEANALRQRLEDGGWEVPGSITSGKAKLVAPSERGMSLLTGIQSAGGAITAVQTISEPGPRQLCLVVVVSLHERTPDADALVTLCDAISRVLARLAKRALSGGRAKEGVRWITEREQEILDYLILGLSVPEISKKVDRSPHTVHDHIKKLHAKTGVQSRGELVARALGWSEDSDD